ncbi:MAG: hypothetical protein AAB646_02775 [Patescibacteria group bacterium]
MPDTEEISKQKLREIFNKQAGKLIDLGYEKLARKNSGLFFLELRRLSNLIKRMPPLTIHAQTLPLLIVVNRECVSLSSQIRALNSDDCEAALDIADCESLPSLKSKHFLGLIFSVRLKKAAFSKQSVNDIFFGFRVWSRQGLAIDEGLALATHYSGAIHGHSLLFLGGQPPSDLPESGIEAAVSTRPWPVLSSEEGRIRLRYGDFLEEKEMVFPSCFENLKGGG